MIIFKRIKMTKYISNTGEGKEIFNKDVWFPLNKPPKVPYYKIRIKIIKTEKRYIHNRPKKKDWLRFFNFGV